MEAIHTAVRTKIKYFSKRAMKIFFRFLILTFFLLNLKAVDAAIGNMYWSTHPQNKTDSLSRVIVEKILKLPLEYGELSSTSKLLFGRGTILNYAREGDVIWGAGFYSDSLNEEEIKYLDVRAVRGPRTRELLLQRGIDCPEVYGDPAILVVDLFPEYQRQKPLYDYIIIPHAWEMAYFAGYKNLISPSLPWDELLQKILQTKLVISSALQPIILAESYQVPARMLRMNFSESLFKYQDYYESTGRADFKYATSVRQALEMGGAKMGFIDHQKLLEAFPWDYFYDK